MLHFLISLGTQRGILPQIDEFRFQTRCLASQQSKSYLTVTHWLMQPTSFQRLWRNRSFDSLCIQISRCTDTLSAANKKRLQLNLFKMSNINPPTQLNLIFSRWLTPVPSQQPFKQCCGPNSSGSVIIGLLDPDPDPYDWSKDLKNFRKSSIFYHT
jgi:hypothetical protein